MSLAIGKSFGIKQNKLSVPFMKMIHRPKCKKIIDIVLIISCIF